MPTFFHDSTASAPKNLLTLLLLVLFSLAAAYAMAPFGAATTIDSLYYLKAAEHFAAGRGVVQPNFELTPAQLVPMTTWPPLYPVALSPLLAAGIPAEIAAKYLNLVALAASVAIFFALASRIAGPLVAALAGVILAVHPAMLAIHSYAWSESLFLALILLAYLFTLNYLVRVRDPGSRVALGWLLAACVFVALSCYTRYIGTAFIPALLLTIMISRRESPRRALAHAIGAATAMGAGVAPLLTRNFLHTGHLSGAERGIPENRLLPDMEQLVAALNLNLFASDWVVAAVVLGLLAAVWGYAASRRGRNRPLPPAAGEPGILVPAIWVVSYCILLVVARSFQNIDIDTRMVSILIPFIILVLLALGKRLSQSVPLPLALAPLVLWAGILAWNGAKGFAGSLESWRAHHTPGFQAASGLRYRNFTANPNYRAVRNLYDDLRKLEADPVIISDFRPILFHYLTGAKAKQLPARLDPDSVTRINAVGAAGGFLLVTTEEGAGAVSRAYGADWAGLTIIDQAKTYGVSVIALPLPLPQPPRG